MRTVYTYYPRFSACLTYWGSQFLEQWQTSSQAANGPLRQCMTHPKGNVRPGPLHWGQGNRTKGVWYLYKCWLTSGSHEHPYFKHALVILPFNTSKKAKYLIWQNYQKNVGFTNDSQKAKTTTLTAKPYRHRKQSKMTITKGSFKHCQIGEANIKNYDLDVAPIFQT